MPDREIGRALALIHRDPGRDWTVASLAGELALSRSAFAARFTQLVNEPAIRYVTRWRMQPAPAAPPRRAGDVPAQGDRGSVTEICFDVGFRAVPACFAKAWTRPSSFGEAATRREG